MVDLHSLNCLAVAQDIKDWFKNSESEWKDGIISLILFRNNTIATKLLAIV